MRPYYQADGITIYNADCRDVLPSLNLTEIDCVLTDPPYDVSLAEWDRPAHDTLSDLHARTKGPIFWFGAATRVRGDLIAFDPPPDRICIWSPRFTLSKTGANGLFYRWHPIYCWRLSDRIKGSDVFDDQCDGHNWWYHPATKPLALLTKLAKGAMGAILDPFLGSGTTCVAARGLNLPAIGIEINERFCEIAAKRLAQGVFDWENEPERTADGVGVSLFSSSDDG